jgi:hypothetical protein
LTPEQSLVEMNPAQGRNAEASLQLDFVISHEEIVP